jgi:hypothetical protein
MSDDREQVIPTEIRTLLDQRLTYQEWLVRLDTLGGEYRPEVAAKVRGDYQDRLHGVEGELSGHRTVLESSLAERRESLGGILQQHDARTAELEESELRHKVGEYNDSEWEGRRGEHQAVLDELDGELTRERAAVEELERVLSELSGAAGAGVLPAEEAVAVATVDEAFLEIEPHLEADEEAAPEPAAEALATAAVEEPEAQVKAEPELYDETEVEEELAEVAEELEEEVAEPEPHGEVEVEGGVLPEDEIVAIEETAAAVEVVEDEREFMDELEFLESLSLEDPESFDAVSAMLEDEQEGTDAEPAEGNQEQGGREG